MQRDYAEQRKYLYKKLGHVIKQIREQKNKSITLVSNEADLSKSIWADLENGKKDPQFTTIWRIAETLEVPLSEIILLIEKEIPDGWSIFEQ